MSRSLPVVIPCKPVNLVSQSHCSRLDWLVNKPVLGGGATTLNKNYVTVRF